MSGNIAENKSIWILEDDKGCQFVYEQILDFRYNTTYLDSISELREKVSSMDEKSKPALVIADLVLKDGNFLNFLSTDSSDKMFDIPFIVVSSIDDIDALRFCFNEGALDYLTKPFKKNELLVKIENALSNQQKAFVEYEKSVLTIDGVKVEGLTSKQTQLLSLFANSQNRIVNRNDILEKVWGDTTVHPKTVDVHLYNLRRKLHPYGYFIRSEGGGMWSLRRDRKDL